ncbi:hypothetical protein [Nostoc sp.]|uniref:hypothetical protein n=1 Tax=Nostoc sp. TaxID=1180 RepID=UPI002FF6AE9C
MSNAVPLRQMWFKYLNSAVTPAISAQKNYYRSLGLRERLLTLPKKGRRQEQENIFFALCHFLLDQVNLFMKKEENMYFEMRSVYLPRPY